MPSLKGNWYILTLSAAHCPNNPCESYSLGDTQSWDYAIGQQEIGEGGFLHWQFCVHFINKNTTLGMVKRIWPQCHAELTRSSAARDYVRKEETRVPNTEFEYGSVNLIKTS